LGIDNARPPGGFIILQLSNGTIRRVEQQRRIDLATLAGQDDSVFVRLRDAELFRQNVARYGSDKMRHVVP
jgi:hypothetical protein